MMRYRKLGRSGLDVSEIGLGCEHLQDKDYQSVESVISEARARGINIMDVFMSEPQIRTDIGRAISGTRDKWIIQGHIGAAWKDGQYLRSRDIAENKFFFEDLLERLQTGFIDIGMLHFVDTESDYASVFETEIIDYARELKKSGKINLIGLSSHNPAVAKKAVETGLVDVLMFSVNPAFDLLPSMDDINELFKPEKIRKHATRGTHPDRAALYAACVEHGSAITVMKTFGGGTLFYKDVSFFGQPIKPNPLINFALTRPAVASALIGCVNAEQVRLAASFDPESAESDFAFLYELDPKYKAEGQCLYCNHCLPCASGIDIALVNKYVDLSGVSIGKALPPTVAAHYWEQEVSASDCAGCGECEKRCPFGVKIIERMKLAQTVFGK